MSANEALNSNTAAELKISMEKSANAFNLKCLSALCGFTLLSGMCNRIGIFTVDPFTMKVAVIAAILSFSAPILIWLLHDRLLKITPTILTWSGFKFLVVFSIYFGIAVTCVTLTFHAILLMVLPGIFAAQYPDQKRLLKWVLLGSVVLVPVGVYGGFFFGIVDLNLFSGLVDKGVLPLEDRLAQAGRSSPA